jgi:hypothetical protein
VLAELGLTQAEPVAWRVPGGQWEDGQPYQSDIDLLEKAKLKPEYAYAAPQPQASPQAGVVEALEFYADPRRHQGSNQRPFDGDKFTPEGYPYMIDATRDGGDIARAALAAVKEKDRG